VRCDQDIDEDGLLDMNEEGLIGSGTSMMIFDSVIFDANKHNIFDKAKTVSSGKLSLNDLRIEGTQSVEQETSGAS
jgi:hypothetical protein